MFAKSIIQNLDLVRKNQKKHVKKHDPMVVNFDF